MQVTPDFSSLAQLPAPQGPALPRKMPSPTGPSMRQSTNPSLSGHGASRCSNTSVWQADNIPPDFGQSLEVDAVRSNGDTSMQVDWRAQISPPKQQPQRENLKLAPSPTPNMIPTHRSEVERRNEDRMHQLIRNGGSTSQSTSPIANIRGQKLIPTPLKLERNKSQRSMTDEGPPSPRKKLLNKLGFGGLMSKPNARPSPGVELAKVDITMYKEIPPKAAQLLGAESLSSRIDPGTISVFSHQHPRSDADFSPTRSRSAASATPSRQRSGGHSRTSGHSRRSSQSKAVTPTFIMHDQDAGLLALNVRPTGMVATGIGPNLRFYDDVTPPTPPSKSKSKTGSGDRIPGDAQDSKIRSHGIMHQIDGEESPTRLGITGYRSRAELVPGNPATRSVYGALSVIEEASPAIGVLPEGNAADRLVPPSFRFAGNALPSYSPSMYQDDDSPRHWPSSANSLVPNPLHLPHDLHHVDVASHSIDSPSRSRDTSNSTSASVPIFLDSVNDSVFSPARAEHACHSCHPSSHGIQQLPQVDSENGAQIASDTDGAAPSGQVVVDPQDLVGILQSTRLAVDSTIRNKLCSLEERLTARIDKLSKNENARLEKLGSTVDKLRHAVDFTMQHQQAMQDTIQGLVEEVIRQRGNANALRLELAGQQRLQPILPANMSQGLQPRGGIPADPADVANGSYGTSRTLNAMGRMPAANPGNNQYFASLGQQREIPDIRHHPYFNRSSH